MRKATVKWIDGQFDAVLRAVTDARLAAGSALKRVERELHEAEDRANERHAALGERIDSLETQLEVALGKLIERQTRSIAVQKHDRRVVPVGRVTSLPTPAPKVGGTSTPMAVLHGGSVDVVPRTPPKEPKPAAAVGPAREGGAEENDVVTSTVAAMILGVDGRSIGRRASLGQVAGAKRNEDGRWTAPLRAWRELADSLADA